MKFFFCLYYVYMNSSYLEVCWLAACAYGMQQ